MCVPLLNRLRVLLVALVLLLATLGAWSLAPGRAARAEGFADPAFQQTWRRTDAPVALGAVARSWVWGPEPRTGAVMEPYADAPGGQRLVQYFDKSRMELTNPRGDPASPFYVTNGLLATEMLTGAVQTGDTRFEAHAPAEVPAAGDLDDPDGPTYAAFAAVRAAPPLAMGTAIIATLTRDGAVGNDPALAGKATARQVVPETKHTVADVFWAFMTARGIVDGGATEPLFRSPFYATGFPLTEAYWTTVRVAGTPTRTLVQVFERRALTYTPGNPAGFQVEAGNVGLQYRAWRAAPGAPPTATPAPTVTPVPTVAVPTAARTAPQATAVTSNETPSLAALIAEVAYDGDATSHDANAERIVILNGSDRPLDLLGWTVRDTRGHIYTFAALTLPVDGSVTLYGGKGSDSATVRYWGNTTGILDDTGPETITLRDSSGTLIDAYPYP